MASTLVAAISTPAGNMAALQAVVNAAAPGDFIRLTPGGFYDGTLTLPSKAYAAATITIRSDAAIADLPAAGTQTSPAYSAFLPKFRVLVNNTCTIKTCNPSAGVAHGWRLENLELIGNTFGGGALLDFGSGNSLLADKQDTIAKVPRNLVADRLYMHGLTGGPNGQRRAIALHAYTATVRECYIENCWSAGADSQAIFGSNGIGDYTIVNNYLEGAGENVLMGGADPIIPGLVPSGMLFERNYCTKPIAWRGSTKQIKNLFELKNFKNAVIRGNRFWYTWSAAQHYAIVFTPANSDGTGVTNCVQDVLFEYNWIRYCAGGMNISAHDAGAHNFVSARTARITVRHNLFSDMGTAWGSSVRELATTSGSLVNTFEGVLDLLYDHNTVISSGCAANLYFSEKSSTLGFPKHENLIVRNNLFRRTGVGLAGSGGEASEALNALALYAPGSTVYKNVFATGTASRYPAGNFFPNQAAWEATFTDFAGGDYSLAPASPYKNAGTDGLDLGADLVTLASLWAGAEPPETCTYDVLPTAVAVADVGGSSTLAVTTGVGCGWTAVSNAAWLTVDSGTPGTGSGSVGYTVAANVGAARVGTFTVAGVTVTISQAAVVPPAPTCEYLVDPLAASPTALGGVYGFDITTGAACDWTAVANVAWLAVSQPAGTGSATLTVTVAANTTTSPRSGTCTIAGETVTVLQGAAGCSYALSVSDLTPTQPGGSSTIAVTTQGGCAWTAVSDAAWLTIDSGTPGVGSGTVGYTVAANATGLSRTALLTIADQVVSVYQVQVRPAPAPMTPLTPEPVPAEYADLQLYEWALEDWLTYQARLERELPQLCLQWSDDGGHTWSDEVWTSAGAVGQYKHRAVWRRLGRARQRTFRLTVSAAVKLAIVDTFVEVR